MNAENRVIGSLIGLAVGDALGTTMLKKKLSSECLVVVDYVNKK